MITIGLLFGGANSEHEVSLASARSIADALTGSRFGVTLIGIDRGGGFHRLDSAEQIDDLDELATAGGGTRFPDLDGIDVAFPALHGRFGEDGTVQGLLEIAGVPYVGCGVLSSALAMDKRMAGRALAAAGIPVVPTRSTTWAERTDANLKAAELGYPVFVKPNRAGSSVGATRVDSAGALASALDDALAEDERALIQPLVDGEEIDLGILELPDRRLVVGAPLRIRPAAGSAFFDYAAKYTDGGVEFEVPALLEPATTARMVGFAERAFRALGCSGLARVDFFLAADGTLTVNEVNTMPGLTAHSQYPRMFAGIGMCFPDLLETLVETAAPSLVSVAARGAASARAASARAGSS